MKSNNVTSVLCSHMLFNLTKAKMRAIDPFHFFHFFCTLSTALDYSATARTPSSKTYQLPMQKSKVVYFNTSTFDSERNLFFFPYLLKNNLWCKNSISAARALSFFCLAVQFAEPHHRSLIITGSQKLPGLSKSARKWGEKIRQQPDDVFMLILQFL